MNKIPTIQKVQLFNGDNYITYLVRNVGKRAIIVRLMNSVSSHVNEQSEKIVVLAAIEAAKLGYKKIVVNYHEGYLKANSWTEFYRYNFTIHASPVTQTGYVGTVSKQDVEYVVIPANYRTRKEPWLKSKE